VAVVSPVEPFLALAVAPASDVRALKTKTVEQARRELGVNLALEGSLYATGDTVQVNYSLVDAGTLRSLRSETIDVSAIAALRGGGGHKLAAGFSSDERPEEVIAWLSSELERRFSWSGCRVRS
jgi:nanoRNase/pAp phosphatase (c-di-AMP/oligoRNAs hydrolase)